MLIEGMQSEERKKRITMIKKNKQTRTVLIMIGFSKIKKNLEQEKGTYNENLLQCRREVRSGEL
jgi:hypothetical protein